MCIHDQLILHKNHRLLKSIEWKPQLLLTKVMMDSSRFESASFFSVSWAFCSLKPILWKSPALSITDRLTITGEKFSQSAEAKERNLILRGNSHMHGIDYTFVAAQARSRRLGRDWLGLLDLHLFWRCHSTFPKVDLLRCWQEEFVYQSRASLVLWSFPLLLWPSCVI